MEGPFQNYLHRRPFNQITLTSGKKLSSVQIFYHSVSLASPAEAFRAVLGPLQGQAVQEGRCSLYPDVCISTNLVIESDTGRSGGGTPSVGEEIFGINVSD